MKQIGCALIAGLFFTSGCATNYVVAWKAKPHQEWSKAKSDNVEVAGQPAYYALLPLTIPFDVATSPVQFCYLLTWPAAKFPKAVPNDSNFSHDGSQGRSSFSGSVKAGKRFEQRLGNDLVFALEPQEFGWEIVIHGKDKTENWAGLTPPLHGPNSTSIEGWHFRNENNTGPNTGKLNFPQREREFIFSPEAPQLIGKEILWADIERIQSFGRGTFSILRLKLSPPIRGGTADILEMDFRCTIFWK